jgi:hypothetical protein
MKGLEDTLACAVFEGLPDFRLETLITYNEDVDTGWATYYCFYLVNILTYQ